MAKQSNLVDMNVEPVNVILYPVPRNETKYSRMDQVKLVEDSL